MAVTAQIKGLRNASQRRNVFHILLFNRESTRHRPFPEPTTAGLLANRGLAFSLPLGPSRQPPRTNRRNGRPHEPPSTG
jgi:hypothetical protein